MPPKTVIEKLQSPAPDVTVFKICGTLGFHEKETLEKLFHECKKRHISRIVFEVGELSSLGGGCAKIIRDNVAGGGIVVGMAAAKSTVLKFLQKQADLAALVTADTLDETITAIGKVQPATPGAAQTDDELTSDEMLDAVLRRPEDDVPRADTPAKPAASKAPAAKTPPPSKAAPSKPAAKAPAPAAQTPPAAPQPAASGNERELQKRIVQHNTLLTINADFVRMKDRKSLLDAFLLTVIAQVGVESAVFLESNQGYYVPATAKGIGAEDLRGFAVAEEHLGLTGWRDSKDVYTIEGAPFSDDAKAPLLSLGCAYVAPFIVHGNFKGIVLLGQPIRNELDDATIEFLKILINQAAVAFESLSRFEEENERTLGLVQTLITLIEENTLIQGSTQMVSGYVYTLAQRLCFDEENLKDLMYGTMLRDIGMIKVSDLIVRSPRELLPEEWEIIKRHPVDGAQMLRNMKFGEVAVNIVLSHHERFNGEGYPRGIHGHDIPLGARIVSVVESYCAMLQERATRPALSPQEALATLKENWGMRYDPDVVAPFVEIIEAELNTGDNVTTRKFELFRN